MGLWEVPGLSPRGDKNKKMEFTAQSCISFMDNVTSYNPLPQNYIQDDAFSLIYGISNHFYSLFIISTLPTETILLGVPLLLSIFSFLHLSSGSMSFRDCVFMA